MSRLFAIRRCLIATLTAAIVLTLVMYPASMVRAEISQRDAQALAGKELIYIATVRKDGNQSKAAPVWFTTTDDKNAILIQTGKDTWKAKRIKRGSPVLVWIGSAVGPAFIGRAEITSDPSMRDKILGDFRVKYWQNRVMGVGPSRARFDSGERVAIKITPTCDLPEGFASKPGTPAPPVQGSVSPPAQTP